MRLFVAVRPPPGAVAHVRDPHVTLCFLGEVPDDDVARIESALRAGLGRAAPVEAVVAGGRPRRLGPSALVRPVGGLDDLAAVVRSAVGRDAARPERRPFRGHLTVARRRRGEPGGGDGREAPEVRWLVEEVALVCSELGRGEGGTARHRDVAVVALDRPG